MNLEIRERDVSAFIRELAGAPQRLAKGNYRWVERLTSYAHKRMKIYSRAKSRSPSARGTGKLSGSINKNIETHPDIIKGISYVPQNIGYQFAAEYGFKTFKVRAIKSKGFNRYMVFHYSVWKKALRSSRLRKMANANGYFFFKAVSRGKYPGMYFTFKAFTDLANYYNNNRDKIAKQTIGDITMRAGGVV